MSGRRVSRVEDLIREEISRLLLYKIKDPRLSAVTVTRVKMTGDLKKARIYYGVFDDRLDREDVSRGMERAAGFFRREVGRVVGLKFVPELEFEYDRSLEYAQHMDQVFRDLKDATGTGDDEDAF
ncbi:MAG: 30S ribosome-binding factor RbfA [Proteobacteria bacterium]|nr:30S ribosome-binding factor RbfA [Pseudomonadota bacterium]